MADLDFYSSECNTETLSRFMLKRKPSSESIRERLTSLTNPPPPKQTIPKHSPKLIRISRNILKRKPQHVKHEEAELKKITLDRLYFARQQENAHERNNTIIPAIKKQKQLITHIGQQQLNAIKDHIQVIKQDISNRYPELPSPKPDNWFRQDETEDTPSDTTSHSSSSALHRRVTKKSRAIIEQGVVAPIHRKIKSFTHKTSAPSLTSHHATTPETTTTTRPEKLSIITQGLPPQPGRESASSADYVPLRPYLKETSAVSLTHRPASNSSSSALPQWSTSAMVYLADDPTGQIDRWVFSSSLIPHATDPRPLSRRPAHRVSLDLPSRDSSETHRRKSESDTLSQPAFSYAPLNDPDHQAADSSSPFGGSNVIQDPQYFVEKQKPSQVILATDVLIEQQGGLSFLGKENFNERFRSQPWQTVKTIRQYNRPGHLDAEYLPDVSRVAVVPTPHSTDTFPMPTPEWYSLTGFSIDKQTKSVDPNGWEYYDIFSRKWSPNRHGCRTFIRRRRWVRVRGKLDSSAVPDPSLIDLPSSSLSPPIDQPAHQPALDDRQPIIVILRKQGVDQCITFDTLTVDGGYTLTFTLPGQWGDMEVHWDDSALARENPLFSSQIVVAEVLRYVDAISDGAATRDGPESRVAIVQCLNDHLARINLHRVLKTLAGLSDLQKINLWNYWLQVDAPSMMRNKPDSEDIWRVLDRHIEEVQGSFVFDMYRGQFLKMVAMLYTHGWSGAVARVRKARRRRSGQGKAGPGSMPMTTTTTSSSSTGAGAGGGGLPGRAFLRPDAGLPSFLDTRNLRLLFWTSQVALLSSDPKLPSLPSSASTPPLFRLHSHTLLLRLTVATDIRFEIRAALKLAKKLRRNATLSSK